MKTLICLLFHWSTTSVPSGVHRYACTCNVCGRKWDETE